MKKTLLFALATAVLALGTVGCSASAKLDIPRGSITKPAKEAQIAYVTVDKH